MIWLVSFLFLVPFQLSISTIEMAPDFGLVVFLNKIPVLESQNVRRQHQRQA